MSVFKKLFWFIIGFVGAVYTIIILGYAIIAPFLWLFLGNNFKIGTYYQNVTMIPMMIFDHMEKINKKNLEN